MGGRFQKPIGRQRFESPRVKKNRVEIPVCTKRKEAIVIKFYHRLVGLTTLSNIFYLSNTQKRRVLRGP